MKYKLKHVCFNRGWSENVQEDIIDLQKQDWTAPGLLHDCFGNLVTSMHECIHECSQIL